MHVYLKRLEYPSTFVKKSKKMFYSPTLILILAILKVFLVDF